MHRIVGAFPPIGIDYSPRKLRAGKKNLLRIMLEIPEGFDIMAHKPSEEFLIPAELKFKSVEGFIIGEPTYPEPYEQKFDWMETKLRVYKGRIEVGVPIDVAGANGKFELPGILTFQGCTENQCLPPRQQEFSISLEVE